jgi:hypothetical protein
MLPVSQTIPQVSKMHGLTSGMSSPYVDKKTSFYQRRSRNTYFPSFKFCLRHSALHINLQQMFHSVKWCDDTSLLWFTVRRVQQPDCMNTASIAKRSGRALTEVMFRYLPGITVEIHERWLVFGPSFELRTSRIRA